MICELTGANDLDHKTTPDVVIISKESSMLNACYEDVATRHEQDPEIREKVKN